MRSKFIFVSIIILTSQLAISQILPKEGGRYNFRFIGFSVPAQKGVFAYRLEVSRCNTNRADSFKKVRIVSTESKSPRFMEELPLFGTDYTWRITYLYKGKKKGKDSTGAFYHFALAYSDHADTSKYRIRNLLPARGIKDHFIGADGGCLLYGLDGMPVWFMPDDRGIGGFVADLQFTRDSTLTFIYDRNAFETDFMGHIIWMTRNTGKVSGDSLRGELYHHEFTKLRNGHYLALGIELLPCKNRGTAAAPDIEVARGKPMMEAMQEGYTRARFGTLIEYNQQGDITWTWKSSEHLPGSDFDYYKCADSNMRFDPHENAFYFDEDSRYIYLCFRNLSRVIKIKYPEGNIVDIYGERFAPGMTGHGAGFFCNPHAISRSEDGSLYYFNNNSCNNTDSLPTVVKFREPVSPGEEIRKVWEYHCTVTGNVPKKFSSGGNAVEFGAGNLFVNMGSDYSKLFILDKDQKEIWSALPERHIETDMIWVPLKEYRCTIISRSLLERLCWQAEEADARVN